MEITNEDIAKLLMEDWGVAGRKQRIFALYRQGLSNDEIAEHLRSEYNKHGYTPEERAHEGPCVLADGGEGYGYFVAAEWRLRRRNVDGPMRYIKYEEMAAHIRTLIDEGRYLTPEELAQAIVTANHEQAAPVHVPEATPPVPAAAPAQAVTQADIDAAIQEWNGDVGSKRRVQQYMTEHAREKDTADWLKNEYGDDLPAYPIPGREGRVGTDLSWPKVQRNLARLVKEDRFLSEAELDNLANVDAATIKEPLADSGTVPAPAQESQPAPTVREIYEHYKPIVRELVLADVPYQNACKNSDKATALIEGNEAVKRAAATIIGPDFNLAPDFMRLYFDMADFHNRLHREILDETYPGLSQPQQEQTTDQEQERIGITEQPVTREGDIITIGSGDATHEVDITVSDAEWQTI